MMKRAWRNRMHAVVMTIALTATLAPMVIVAGCAQKTANVVTDQGKRSVAANEVLIRVERLQQTTIGMNREGQLDRETSRAIVYATVQIATFAESAAAGWEASARQAWAQAKKEIPYLSQSGPLTSLVVAVDALLAAALPVQAPPK